ncbi:MAG: hypothetical protein OXH57_12890 [Ekhidna sp.]|nr:hypothetical protein [Ekhidna sp.]
MTDVNEARLTDRNIKHDTLVNADITRANGLWSDGMTLWVVDGGVFSLLF